MKRKCSTGFTLQVLPTFLVSFTAALVPSSLHRRPMVLRRRLVPAFRAIILRPFGNWLPDAPALRSRMSQPQVIKLYFTLASVLSALIG